MDNNHDNPVYDDGNERDSSACEDLNEEEMQQILVPPNILQFPQFACAFSIASFHAWTKQDSPCCAASSLGMLTYICP